MFNTYESKPVTRIAYQLQPEDIIVQYGLSDEYKVVIEGNWVTFKAHQAIEDYDWVVYLTEEDVYHCSDEVFRARNIVE
jgi:hypothetical protein